MNLKHRSIDSYRTKNRMNIRELGFKSAKRRRSSITWLRILNLMIRVKQISLSLTIITWLTQSKIHLKKIKIQIFYSTTLMQQTQTSLLKRNPVRISLNKDKMYLMMLTNRAWCHLPGTSCPHRDPMGRLADHMNNHRKRYWITQ